MKIFSICCEAFRWVSAIFIAAVICNSCLFLYHRPPGWIDREHAATKAIWNPGSTIVHGKEGRGIYKVDSRGYVNDDLPLQKEYWIVAGASHTQGKEITRGKRYSDLLNAALRKDNTALAVYNIGMDGHYFPVIIHELTNITKEFPDAKGIIIEMSNSSFSKEELFYALEQNSYDANESGAVISETMEFTEKIKLLTKEMTPLRTILKEQYRVLQETYNSEDEKILQGGENNESDQDEDALIDKICSCIADITNCKVIIIYHPRIALSEEGMAYIGTSDTQIEMFKKSAEAHGITFIDATDAFLTEVNINKRLPYGFMNTAPGSGHLNRYGHSIVAELLLEEIKDEKQ